MSNAGSETTSTPDSGAPVEKIASALTRYRILAWITGLWLLLLVVELVMKYGYDSDALDFVPFVHGWVYVIYLFFTVDLAIKVRWPAGKIILTAIAGTIPLLSFWVEHLRTKEVKQTYGLGGRSL